MTEAEARALGFFLSALGIPTVPVQFEETWRVQYDLYSFIDEWPTDAIDNLFWSDPHQALVAPAEAEQA